MDTEAERNEEMKLSKLGLFGILSLLSYTAMVVFSPLAYPGYNWVSTAVSELSAVGAPSKELAEYLNCLHGPCSLVCIMAVCVAVQNCKAKLLRIGIYCFAGMEWVSSIGYKLFPWVSDAPNSHPQNVMHLVTTAFVVILSLASMILSIIGSKKEGMKSLFVLAIVCLTSMILGPFGMAVFPASVFGIFERFSVFSAVVFNAGLGVHLFLDKFGKEFK